MTIEDDNIFLRQIAASKEHLPIPREDLLDAGFSLVDSLPGTRKTVFGVATKTNDTKRIYTKSGVAVNVELAKETHFAPPILTQVTYFDEEGQECKIYVTDYNILELRLWIPDNPNAPIADDEEALVASIVLTDNSVLGAKHGAVGVDAIDDLTAGSVGEIFLEL